MQINVTHSTTYHYDFPVYLEPHIFRLQPRTNSAQRLISFDIQIYPTPAGTTECLDQDGNLAVNAWFDSPTNILNVTSQFKVQMLRANPFDYLIIGESLNLPLWYREPLSSALFAYRLDGHISESVKQFAQSIAVEVNHNTLSFLTTLSKRLYDITHQVVRPFGDAWQSVQTLQQREGSCRDLAVLFCDLCRVVGIAARFVSGYECASAGSDEPYMHAWAEVYLPGIGWRGYDPARGVAVSNGHVVVAAGFDAILAAPVAGWYSGWSTSKMEAALTLTID